MRVECLRYGDVVNAVVNAGLVPKQVTFGAPFIVGIFDRDNEVGYMVVYPWSSGEWTVTLVIYDEYVENPKVRALLSNINVKP